MDDDPHLLLLDPPRSRPHVDAAATAWSPAASVSALRRRCEALRARQARLHLSLALSAARFVACQGPGWMCCASRADYAREHLGVSPARFGAYVQAGELVQDVPEVGAAVLEGRLGWSAVGELARLPSAEQVASVLELACGRTAREVRALVDRCLCELHAAESADASTSSGPDSERRSCEGADESTRTVALDPLSQARYVAFALPLPPEVALYAEETLQLARAVVGFDAPVDIAMAAVVAEASERIDVTVAAAEACRRFGVRAAEPDPGSQRAAAALTRRTRQLHSLANARLGSAATNATGSANANPAAIWRLDPLHPSRRNAHRLDRWLRRQTGRLQQTQVHLEDQLLVLHLENAPARLGYRGLAAMAEALLDLPASTTWDYLRRARRRRMDHPIATARAQGRISEVHADLLEQLPSQAHVPASALPAWIDRAERCTVRKLRDMLAWARRQLYTDARAWGNAGYLPPDDQQLRTSSRLIEDIAKDPTPPDPVPLLLEAANAPTVRVQWVLETGTLVALLQLMASLQDRIQRDHEAQTGELCPRAVAWWAFLAVLVLARRGWAPLARVRSGSSYKILSRERFRCAAAGCTRMRGLEDHHLDYRGRGGCDEMHNRACLCGFHHRLGEHGGILRVRGKADPDARALRWQLALDCNGRPTRIVCGDEIVYDARRWRPRGDA